MYIDTDDQFEHCLHVWRSHVTAFFGIMGLRCVVHLIAVASSAYCMVWGRDRWKPQVIAAENPTTK